MTTATDSLTCPLQLFAPDPEALHPLEIAAQLAGMPRHLVLVCCRRALVSPQIDPNYGGLYFDRDAIRQLQRIEYLRTTRGVSLAGIEIILKLLAELEVLREQADRG